MKNTSRIVGSLVLCLLALSVALPQAFADKAKAPLNLGIRTGEVVTQWGAPTEKIERALKNEVVWHYPGGAFVTFKGGKVIAYRLAGGAVVDATSQAAAVQAQQTIAAAPTAAVAGATRDLVRDIARELPSNPDVPYTEPAPDSSAGIRGPRNPPAPPPPAMVPGDIEDELDETE